MEPSTKPKTKTASLRGKLTLTKHGKERIGWLMFFKGRSFLQAAILLRDSGGTDSAVPYLFCQAFEVMLKGLLLVADYDKYASQLKNPIGHDLLLLAQEVSAAFGRRGPRAALAKQLKELSSFYAKGQRLRYGSGLDIFFDMGAVPTARMRRILNHVLLKTLPYWPES